DPRQRRALEPARRRGPGGALRSDADAGGRGRDPRDRARAGALGSRGAPTARRAPRRDGRGGGLLPAPRALPRPRGGRRAPGREPDRARSRRERVSPLRSAPMPRIPLRRAVALAALACLRGRTALAAEQTLALDPAATRIEFTLGATLHTVTGQIALL